MASPLYSSSWYRVKDLKPRLRAHAEIHRHHYRGQLWYVLQDLTSERFHRFTPAAYEAIGLMDGGRTVQEIWDLVNQRLGDDAPTQEQMIQLLGQLHGADVLQSEVPPDTAEILKRHERLRRRRFWGVVLNPLSWKFPLFDPEKLLRRLFPAVRPLFSKTAALVWLVVVGAAVAQASIHFDELTQNVVDRILEPSNLLLLWLVLPLLKVFHEFGHAFAVKAYGGEVHEMGIILLVLTPLPYVDASASTALRSKRERILVGAAGMAVELFIASLALIFWVNAEPGLPRSIAYNIIFVAGVSTILFNANPLLRYDGYYILSDFLEIPNLRARSSQYLGYIWERHLFGRRDAQPPISTGGERAWFIAYALTSAVYRFFLLIAIILFIGGQFFFVGVALAIWAAVAWGVVPVVKAAIYLTRSPRLAKVRPRALAVSSAVVLVALSLIAWIPFPLRNQAEAVVWIPDQAIARAEADGFIERVVAQPGAKVKPGEVLIACRDAVAAAQAQVLEARLRELRSRYEEKWVSDRVEAEIIRDEIAHAEKALERARERLQELLIKCRVEGTFILANPEDLPGQFVQKGTPLAHVLDLATLTARVVVPQEEIDLVRRRTRGVEVRLSERIPEVLPARILREVPAASAELPSTALASQGGGKIATDPYDPEAVRAVQKYFQLELALDAPREMVNIGGRVYVRFDHGWEPLVKRWYRQARQLFLSLFNV